MVQVTVEGAGLVIVVENDPVDVIGGTQREEDGDTDVK